MQHLMLYTLSVKQRFCQTLYTVLASLSPRPKPTPVWIAFSKGLGMRLVLVLLAWDSIGNRRIIIWNN